MGPVTSEVQYKNQTQQQQTKHNNLNSKRKISRKLWWHHKQIYIKLYLSYLELWDSLYPY